MSTNPKKIESAPKPSLKKVEKVNQSTTPDLQVESVAGAADILDSIDDLGEGSESIKVRESSEGVGENRQATAGKFQQFQKQLTKEEAETLKLKLLKQPPLKKDMVKQIRTHVTKELSYLDSQAGGYASAGSYKDLARVVARIRELKSILAQLFHATAEFIKNTWLKVVHGIV
jgi:uncharacterized sporulation protein YeaH/YhbH (DUF444 family)